MHGTHWNPKGDIHHVYCQVLAQDLSQKGGKIRDHMVKESRLSFRARSDLKKALEAIAAKEARSVAQVCEAILLDGIAAYHKEGTKYLNRIISSHKARSGGD